MFTLGSSLIAIDDAARDRGGAKRGGGGARTSVNQNVNARRDVNRDRDVNIDRDVDIDVDYDHDHWIDHPVGAAVAVTATAVAIGSIVNSVPPSCVPVEIGGVTYQQCGSTWYQPQYVGTSVQYVVVESPR